MFVQLYPRFYAMSKIIVSVVIPTFNRRSVLQETIFRVSEQSFEKDAYEVIVIDDGSTDGTKDYLSGLKLPVKYIFLRNPTNLGRAKTRNRGIKAAQGEFILMIDDDIWASSDLIEQHYEMHRNFQGECGVVGAVLVSNEVDKTAVNQFLNNHHLWCYREMREKSDNLPYSFCKTANLSLKRDTLFRTGLFNESYRYYGGEDTEFGYRLRLNNIKLLFSEQAIGYHYHNEDIDSVLDKFREYAKSMLLFPKIHPNAPEETYHGFFIPSYHRGFSPKTLIYNTVKYLLFNNLGIEVFKIIARSTDRAYIFKQAVAKWVWPTLRIQYIHKILNEIQYEHRN
jgi:glycosyltransferase involved in cell wall biosynthesis